VWERLLALPVLAGYGLVVDPVTGAGGVPCLWNTLFNVVCPGCGLSHANAYLWRGHVVDALGANVLIVPVVVVASATWVTNVVNFLWLGEQRWRNWARPNSLR
jgi:uncharacterized protein DUF2752